MIAATQTLQARTRRGPARAGVRGVHRWPRPTCPTEHAELITSELATNAVLHGRTDFRLDVDHDIDSVRIAVFDDGWRLALPAPARR